MNWELILTITYYCTQVCILAWIIYREIVIGQKNKRIDKLENKFLILNETLEGVRKDRNDLHERYMASLEREARHDGKR